MKKFFALMALLTAILTISPVCVSAAGSPEATTKAPDETPTNDDGTNKGDKSPETGAELAFAFVALVTSAGVALVAAKKVTE